MFTEISLWIHELTLCRLMLLELLLLLLFAVLQAAGFVNISVSLEDLGPELLNRVFRGVSRTSPLGS